MAPADGTEMFAALADAGLVMLGGWMTVLLGVSLLRDADAAPLRRAGAAVVLAGVALAVVARAAG